MKKVLSVLGVGIMSVGILSACGSTGELSVKENDTNEENTSQIEEKKNETPEIGTRTNPVKLGETLSAEGVTVTDLDDWEKETVGNFNLTLNKVTRGEEAYNLIKSYNQFNEPAPEGFEFALLDFTYQTNAQPATQKPRKGAVRQAGCGTESQSSSTALSVPDVGGAMSLRTMTSE